MSGELMTGLGTIGDTTSGTEVEETAETGMEITEIEAEAGTTTIVDEDKMGNNRTLTCSAFQGSVAYLQFAGHLPRLARPLLLPGIPPFPLPCL